MPFSTECFNVGANFKVGLVGLNKYLELDIFRSSDVWSVGLIDGVPANTKQSPKISSMLSHRLRRCANIELTLVECSVFVELWLSGQNNVCS